MRDLVAVAGIANSPFVMVVNPDLPAKTMPEFIAYAKANPGKINMASGGNGASTHMFGELFKLMAGVDLVHMPYRGSYMPDLLSGQVQVLFDPIPQSMEHDPHRQAAGAGVTTAKRLDALPDVPPSAISCRATTAVGWFGLTRRRARPPTSSPAQPGDQRIPRRPQLQARLATWASSPCR